MANNNAEVIRYIYEVTGNRELTETAKVLLSVGTATEETEKALKSLADEFAKAQSGRDAIQTYVKTSAALTEVSDKLIIAKAKVAELAAAQTTGVSATAASARELRNAEKSVESLGKQQTTLGLQLNRSNVELQKAGIETTNLSKADAKLAGDIDSVNKRLTTLASETDKAGAGAGRLSKIASTVGGAFQGAVGQVGAFVVKLGTITGVVTVVSSALAALNVFKLFGGAVESATALQSALSEVQAVSGATGKQFQQLKDAAEQAAATTKFTVVEATGALGELARASGDAQQAVGLLAPTLNLAQAAGIGASDAATILTTTLTQFGLAAEEGARIADLFAREANTTNDTVTGLGLAMSYVAPIARQLNLSVESTTAVIGALADQGFRGERAGTALRNVMSQLLDPSSAFAGELSKLNITTRDFTEVIDQLALKGDKGREALLALDAQARPAIASLVNSGGAGIQKLIGDFQQASGEAQRTAQIMGENFGTASKRFGGAIDFLRRSLVEPILEPMSRQFDDAAVRVRAFVETANFKKLADSIKDFAVQGAASLIEFVSKIDFGAVASKVTGVVDSLKTFVKESRDSVGNIVSYFSTATNAVAGTYNAFATVIHSAATGIASAAGVALKALALMAKADYTSEIQQKLAGIKTSSEELNDAANALFESAKANYDQTGTAAAALAGNLDALSAASTKTGDSLKADFSNVESGISGTADAAKAAADSITQAGDAADVAGQKASAQIEKATQLKQALADLGIKSQADLQAAADTAARSVEAVNAAYASGGAAREDLIRATRAWADAERAAAADSTTAQTAATETKITAKIAALGLTDQIKASGAAGTTAGGQISAGMAQAKAAVDAVKTSAQEAEASIIKMSGSGSTTVGDLVYELNKANTSYDSLGEKGKEAFDKVAKAQESGAGGVTGVIASLTNDWSAYFSGISEGAATAFQSVLASANNYADGTSLAIGRYLGALSDGAVLLKQRIAEQKVAVDDLLSGFARFDDGAAGSVTQTVAGLEYMKRALENNRDALDLLDKAGVDKLDGAIKGVETRLQSVRDAAAAARGELASTAADLQDQLDQQDGKAKDIEDRRYARQRQQIVDLGNEKGVQGTKEYNDALANAEKLHARKLEDIASESAAAATAQATTAAASRSSAEATSSAAAAAEREATARERSAAAAAAVASAAAATPTTSSTSTSVNRNELAVTIKTDIGDIHLTSIQVDQILAQLVPALKKSLRDSGAV